MLPALPPVFPRRLGAALLTLAGLFAVAAPPPAAAYDIGAVIDAVRLSRYPLREPERRAWGTENAKDALLVGQMENRLYLYRYVRGAQAGAAAELAFRSRPLVIDPAGWNVSRQETVSVAAPREGQSFYWVAYTYNDADGSQANGFLVDATGAAVTVHADAARVVATADRPWDDARRAAALATLKPALVAYPSPLKAFPADVRYEYQAPVDGAATFRKLHQVAFAIPRSKAAEFNRALADLRRFVLETDYREIDPAGQDPEALAALNDYGFWLAEAGNPAEADAVLGEVLRRDPARTPAYLNRADARLKLRDQRRDQRSYFETLAQEDYRLYCTRRLAAGEPIPAKVAERIGAALGAKALDAAVCRPRLAIFQAIRAGDLDAVRAELARGQDPDGVNENGVSALNAATSAKQIEMVRALLAAGARVDAPTRGAPLVSSALPDGRDTRPLAERYALADVLVAAGASLEAPDSNGTPLLLRRVAYSAEDKDTLDYLLAKGANPNGRDKSGRTVLHAAMGSPARFWFAEKLLAKGADINAAYIRMYYGSQAMWETPLLEALREAPVEDLKPQSAYVPSERVAFALAQGADPAVGGYGPKDGQVRAGLDEAFSLAARLLSPELVDQLAQAAAGKPHAPMTMAPMSSLLRQWNEVELRADAKQNSAEWNGQRARLRATADRLLAAGVPLAYVANATGTVNNQIAPLSLPWLPDDLYQAWLAAGANPSDRSDGSLRLRGVSDPGALPLVIMLQQGNEAKVRMLLEHDAALYATPARCGMAVADMLAWQGSDGGPLSPSAARAMKQVLDGAANAPACDLDQGARVQPYVGMTARQLADRLGITLVVKAPGQ
ncbi:ankyrin repeat domain-containing protein [Achromobacter sp. DH1f]|uniref:ankyrin repeat domain-containing protein n=1 Tax=Achromobacter sp. DH1f TaxID=1397275 RepID=UPI00068FD88A|nr:ankyrin repeat domain-containing protein [Achromobacter sp. DH1f]